MNNKSIIVKLVGLLIAFFAAIMVNEMFGVTAFLLMLAGYAGVAVIAYGIFWERTQINYNMVENNEKETKLKNKKPNILYRVVAKIWDTFSNDMFFMLTEIIILVVSSVVIVIISFVINNPWDKISIVLVLFVLFAFADMWIYLAANRWDFTFMDEDKESDPISNNETGSRFLKRK